MTQQSKLSEALAATLLRFKEIDRDTIEALRKRAATLEQNLAYEVSACAKYTTRALSAEGKLNAIFKALHVPADASVESVVRHCQELIAHGIRECSADFVTETKASGLVKSHNQLQWALRDLLAQTRDLHDAGPEGESYQSDTLENAIAVADSLVGESAAEQYPIADEPLNRRIQELEVQLAEAKKPKGSIHIARDLIETKDGTGTCRIRVGGLDVTKVCAFGASAGEVFIKPSGATDQPVKWSENALRKLMSDVIAEGSDKRKMENMDIAAPSPDWDQLIATTFKEAQDKLPRDMDLKSVITVTGDEAVGALVKDIINNEMRPGGRLHKALIGR